MLKLTWTKKKIRSFYSRPIALHLVQSIGRPLEQELPKPAAYQFLTTYGSCDEIRDEFQILRL